MAQVFAALSLDLGKVDGRSSSESPSVGCTPSPCVTPAELKARCQAVLVARVPDAVLNGDAVRAAQYKSDAATVSSYLHLPGPFNARAQFALFRMEALISRSGALRRDGA